VRPSEASCSLQLLPELATTQGRFKIPTVVSPSCGGLHSKPSERTLVVVHSECLCNIQLNAKDDSNYIKKKIVIHLLIVTISGWKNNTFY
jgi:hypothetical protein